MNPESMRVFVLHKLHWNIKIPNHRTRSLAVKVKSSQLPNRQNGLMLLAKPGSTQAVWHPGVPDGCHCLGRTGLSSG